MQGKTSTKAQRVFDEIRERILSAEWELGEQIPTETELSQEYQCHRTTIGKALARLSHEGLIERKRKTGTRVLRTGATAKSPVLELDAYAFIYPSDKHENIWKIVQGFQEEANGLQRRSIIFATGPDVKKESEIISRLDEFDIRGAAVYPMVSSPEEELILLQAVAKCKFPLVFIGRSLSNPICTAVELDGFHIGYSMAKYLLGTGSKRVGFFTNNSFEQSRRDMLKGYQWALGEEGVAVDDRLVFLERTMSPDFEQPLREPTELGRRYLSNVNLPDAVLCGDDYLALGLIRAAQEMGIRVPDDIRIVGSDDLPIAATSKPSLTTYRVSPEEVGSQAFRLLDRFVRKPDKVPASVEVRGEIIERESA